MFVCTCICPVYMCVCGYTVCMYNTYDHVKNIMYVHMCCGLVQWLRS